MNDLRARVIGRIFIAVLLGGLVAPLDHGTLFLLLLGPIFLAALEHLAAQRPGSLPLATVVAWVMGFLALPLAIVQSIYTRTIFQGASPGEALAAVQKAVAAFTGWPELAFVASLLGTSTAMVFPIREVFAASEGTRRYACSGWALTVGSLVGAAIAVVARRESPVGTGTLAIIVVSYIGSTIGALIVFLGLSAADAVGELEARLLGRRFESSP